MQVRYRYRIYPKEKEKQHLARVFGCARYVGNNTLAYCNELYTQGQKKPSYNKLSERLTGIKKITPWLAAVNILNAGNAILQPVPESVIPVITKQETICQPLLETPVQLNLFSKVAGGQQDTNKKRASRKRKSTPKKVVNSNEMSTQPEFNKQLSLFDRTIEESPFFKTGRMSTSTV